MASLGDIIFELGQWLRTTPLTEIALWLQKQPTNGLVDKNFWVMPTIQTIHILAIAVTFGSAMMLNLRVLELAGTRRTMAQTAERYLPYLWWGLLTLLVTGILMTFGEPVRELTNPIFWIKMIVVSVAALVSLWFQHSVRRNAAMWELTPEGRVVMRTGAGAVIGMWVLIIFLGRWIAYAPT